MMHGEPGKHAVRSNELKILIKGHGTAALGVERIEWMRGRGRGLRGRCFLGFGGGDDCDMWAIRPCTVVVWGRCCRVHLRPIYGVLYDMEVS